MLLREDPGGKYGFCGRHDTKRVLSDKDAADREMSGFSMSLPEERRRSFCAVSQ